MGDLLGRLRRHAMIIAVLLIAAAAILRPGWAAPAGVAGGALLSAISVVSISTSIEQMSSRPVLAVLKMAGRYALLAFLAYVMIARLRLPPLALIAGVSSLPIAVAIEAARLLTRK
jgi:hypothetical protein